MIRVALIENNPELRQQMSQRLQRHPGLALVVEAVHGADFLNKVRALETEAQPEVALMDIEMEVMDGIEATRKGLEEVPGLQVIMLTVFDHEEKIFDAIQAGAVGYLLKGEPFSEIVKAIEEVYAGGSQISPTIARKALQILQRAPGLAQKEAAENPPGIEDLLSPREAEVLELLVQGMPLPVVADKLHIGYGTVRTHVRRIYEKLQVSNKVEATQVAHKNRWFPQRE